MTETFGQKRSTVHQVAALGICAVLLGGSAAVQAGGAGQAGGADGPSHTFTIVVDSERDGLAATRCPAINTLGTIAVTVVDALGRTSIITKRGANDAPVIDRRHAAPSRTFRPSATTGSAASRPIPRSTKRARWRSRETSVGTCHRLRCSASSGTPAGSLPRQRAVRSPPSLTPINQPGGNFISEFLVADQSVNTLRQGGARARAGHTVDSGPLRRLEEPGPSTSGSWRIPDAGRFNFNNPRHACRSTSSARSPSRAASTNSSCSGIFLSNPDGTFTDDRRQHRRVVVGVPTPR